MGDLLGSLVLGEPKADNIVSLEWVVTNCIRAIAQPEM
jgi:hypothetical protein